MRTTGQRNRQRDIDTCSHKDRQIIYTEPHWGPPDPSVGVKTIHSTASLYHLVLHIIPLYMVLYQYVLLDMHLICM